MLILILIVIVLILLFMSFKVIQQNSVGLVENLGKYKYTAKSGLVFVVPFFQKIRRVSLALQPLAISKYTIITKDNAEVRVSVTLNYKVTDPYKYFYENTDSEESMIQLVRGHLRDIIGRMDLNEALGATKDINNQLAAAIGDLTDTYGISVVRINIDELLPSKEIQQSMDKQLRADRERIAAIAKAEGDAKSIELTTKAQNEAKVATAKADAEARVTQAKAEADATKLKADADQYRIEKIQAALADADESYFKNQSLDSFNNLANGNNNLIVLSRDELTKLGEIPAAKALWDSKEQNQGSSSEEVKADLNE